MRRSRQQKSRGNRDSSAAASKSPAAHSYSPSAVYFTHGVDINTNLGEGFGHYKMPGETDLLPYVTSANVACGAHAGDPSTMENALDEVRQYGLALGAHIGYPDLQGFGRREIHLSSSELRAQVLYQLGALAGVARTMGLEITQVRPHGFLYRQISHDIRIATVVAKAVAEFDRWLVLIGVAGTNLLAAGERAGIRVAGEAWVDRSYDAHGALLPHSHSRAVIKSPHEILNQAQSLINRGEVVAVDGTRVRVEFQTLHLHAGMSNFLSTAEAIRNMIPHACSLTSEPYNIGPAEESELAYGSI
jgi:5-oxoprolinase (ATP-hydrolysing) subunit A